MSCYCTCCMHGGGGGAGVSGGAGGCKWCSGSGCYICTPNRCYTCGGCKGCAYCKTSLGGLNPHACCYCKDKPKKKYPECPNTMTGKHQFVDQYVRYTTPLSDSGTWKVKKCLHCPMVDNRKDKK